MSRHRIISPSVVLTSLVFLQLVFGQLIGPAPGRAAVERLEITELQALAGGQSFGLAGPYEKLAGKIHFALDPGAAANGAIVDFRRAPRDDDGKVRFTADFYLLRPSRAERGNGALFFEVSNRGSKAIVRYFNRGAERSLDPVEAEELGDGFLLEHGFTLAWVGWQFDIPEEREGSLRLEPVFLDGTLTGLVRSDHVFSEPATVLPLGHRGHLAYPVADTDDPQNVLTVREERLGERRVIPREKWSFARLDEDGEVTADPRFIHLAEGFVPGKIYEAVYVGRDPAVVGLGMAAVRDAVAFLRHDPESPARVERTLGMGISQTGRYLRHFLYQGFNADEAGRRVFDGLIIHTAGAGRGSFNHRFAQPSRDAHPFSAFFYPTDLFPFTGAAQRDLLSGREDGLLVELEKLGAEFVPKIFYTNTGYEYWGRGAALIHATVAGADLAPGPRERIYHFASTQHFVGGFPPERQATRHASNPANFLFFLRGFLVALDDWVARDVEPPPSRFPHRADDTLVALDELAFPALPGVTMPRHAHEAYRADYGPRFRSEGIVEREPPGLGPAFPVLVPQVDADGNELGGLRLPQIAVPVATYTPWNFRAKGIGAPGELADFRGSFLPFAVSGEERRASGDPRPSLEERYASRAAYVGRYAEAAVELVRQRYLLAEDLPELLELAGELWEVVMAGERERYREP